MKILSELLSTISILSIHGSTEREVSSIENDSRVCIENSLFVAIRGTTTNDGHSFIEKAIENGARTIVCETLPEILHSNSTYIYVPDTREAVAHLSNSFYDYPSKSLRIIGITGTNGKTTITYLLKQLLESTGEKVGLIGTTGNMIGNQLLPTNYTTPEAPELYRLLDRMRSESITTVVIEVSSHALILKRVLGISFSAALFTNLTHDHLDFHGSMEEYALAKKILFDSLDDNSIAILNGESKYAHFLTEHTVAQTYYCGRHSESDFRIEDEQFSTSETTFRLNRDEYKTPLLGRFNIDNISLCIALCQVYGMDRESIAKVLKSIQGAPGRMERHRLSSGVVAIIDYAHTPDALENALLSCKELMTDRQRLIVIFGCGGSRDISKRAEMGRIAEKYADAIILTNDNPRLEQPQKIIDDILSGITDVQSVKIIPNRSEAITIGLASADSNDVVMIAGKGHETYQITGTERVYFSDRDEVLKYCN